MRPTNTLKPNDKLLFGPARNPVSFVRYNPSHYPVVQYITGTILEDFTCTWDELHRPKAQKTEKKEDFNIGDRVRYTGLSSYYNRAEGTITSIGSESIRIRIDETDFDTPFDPSALSKIPNPRARAPVAAPDFDSNTCAAAFPISSEDTTMKTPIKIENRTFIALPDQSPTDARNLTDDQLIVAIQEGENEIKRLEATEHKPKMLIKRIEDLKTGIADLVTFMDNRPPQK